MIPQRIDPADPQPCALAERWRISLELAVALHRMAARLPFPLSIISGYRDPEHQRRLLADPDSTAAPVDKSTHTSCPATGADLDPGVAATDPVKLAIGEAARLAGLRWGGGARVDSRGIPEGVEWRHVDLGPRKR